MEKIKNELRQLKPKLILITYAAILFLVIINFNGLLTFGRAFLGYLSPLFYAIIIAYVLNIPMTAIEGWICRHTKEDSIFHKASRVIAMVGAIILTFLILTLLIMIVLPEFFASIGNIFINMTSYLNNISDNLASVLHYFNIDIEQITSAQLEDLLGQFGLDYAGLLKEASNWILGTGSGAIDYLVTAGNSLFMIFMGFMISLYLLASKETFVRQMKKVVVALFPEDIAEDILDSATTANGIFNDFVGGKCVECVVVGVMVYAIMVLFKLPFDILISCLCGALTIVPVFGSLVATIIACLLLLSVNLWYPILFFFIYWFVQTMDGNWIYPKFIGKGMGLPAVWILTSVLVFGSMYGVIGTLFAAPLTACLYTFFTNYINKKLSQKNIEPKEA